MKSRFTLIYSLALVLCLALFALQPARAHSIAPIAEEEGTTDVSVSVYPNPANTHCTISYQLPTVANAQLKVYDMLGKVVEEYSLTDSQGNVSLQVKNYKPGIYFCSIEAGGKTVQTRKLIVSR